MATIGSYIASKKKSAVILRTLFPCEFNPKTTVVKEIISVVKDFDTVPPNMFSSCIDGYLARFNVPKGKTAELIGDSTKVHEFVKNDKSYGVRIVNKDSSYKIYISEKVSGYVYGFSYTNEQLVCKYNSICAPSQIFNTQVLFGNYIDEMKARFSTRPQVD